MTSCLEQVASGFSIEVIVVDDASSDETVRIANNFSPVVRVLCHKTNQGRAAARNSGLAAAAGEFIKFLDHDDLLEPDTLRVEYEVGVKQQADIVIAGHRSVEMDSSGNWQILSEVIRPPVMDPRIYAILQGRAVPTAAALYRKSYIEGLTWDEDILRIDDWDWFVRAALRMGRIIPINHISYSWRHHATQYSKSSTLYQYAIEHHRILGKIEDWLLSNGQLSCDNARELAQYYYKMLRVLFKYDRQRYDRALFHIFSLDPCFFPYREPRRSVRFLCRLYGIKLGLLTYNYLANILRMIRS